VDPSIIHITVKFLGEIGESQVTQVREALENIRLEPFTIRLTGISLNNTRNPRVVWGTVLDQGECSNLFSQVEAALAPIGFPREQRGFTPHATVARVKGFDPSLIQSVRPFISKPLGECRVNGFALKKSTLTPKGPLYENIMEVTW
jgi:RNA 2',3'-cyclic 3'-phosphodiesterase